MRSTIELAKGAGFEAMRPQGVLPHVPEAIFIANVCVTEEVNRLVELARADERSIEREACAKVCDAFAAHYWAKHDPVESVIYEECAAAIRARGETK